MKTEQRAHGSVLRLIATVSTFSVLNHWGHSCFYILLLTKKVNNLFAQSIRAWNIHCQWAIWVVLSVRTSEQKSFFPKLPLECSEEPGIGMCYVDGMYRAPSAVRSYDAITQQCDDVLCTPAVIPSAISPSSLHPYLPCKKHKLLKISNYSANSN